MPSTPPTPDPVVQNALAVLTEQFVRQGHPIEYAQYMATSAIFQADLDLRNAQLLRLVSWLKQQHPELYPEALEIVEATRQEFEQRVQENR